MPYTSTGKYYPTNYKSYGGRGNNTTPKPKFMRPDHIAGFVDSKTADEVITFLQTYAGTFPPLVDLRNRLSGNNGYAFSGLSEKQWAMVHNTYKVHKRNTSELAPFTEIKLINPIDIVLNKKVAIDHFKKELKLKYAVYTVKVHSILDSVTSRGGQHKKLTLLVEPNTTGTVNVCRMCGKSLTDHKSIVSGVGPYCAKKLGAGIYHTYKTDIQKFMKEYAAELAKIGKTTVTAWHSQIEGGEILADLVQRQIDNTLPQEVTEAKVLINHVQWIGPLKQFLINKIDKPDINNLYSVLNTKNKLYISVVNINTGKSVRFEDSGEVERGFRKFIPLDKLGKVTTGMTLLVVE